MHPLTIMLTELRQGIIPPNRKPRRNIIPRPPTPPRQPRLTPPKRPRLPPPDPPMNPRPTGCRGVPPRLEIKTMETKKKLDALQRKADEFRKQLSLHSIDAVQTRPSTL